MKTTLLLAGAVVLLSVPRGAEARVTRFVVTSVESPTFGGYSWSGVGQYERIAGKAYAEVDPFDPKNAGIVDIQLAPRNADGKVEFSFDFYIVTAGAPTYALTYPAAMLDQNQATLTHRAHLDDTPEVLPPSAWAYTDDTGAAIRLTGGNFVANDIYELSYVAKDPTVNMVGYAAIRDFNAWLRYERADDDGTPNPLVAKPSVEI